MEKKAKTPLRNPFVYTGYMGPEYFCDRTVETDELIGNLRNGRNTVLISPRRIGKTGLIKNVFHHIRQQEKDSICVYVDIFATKNQHDFVQLLGTAVAQQAFSTEAKAMKRLMEFFGSWRPVFTADPLTGMPQVTVSIEPTQSTVSLKQIFDFLHQSNHEVYVAIDEFQQITCYPESGIEALLRSYIQFVPNVHFIFSGSKRHLMLQIFNSPERPFYQSTVMMGLEPLHEEIYYDFAQHFFNANRGSVGRDIFHLLYQEFKGVTRSIQLILNCLYETEKHVTNESQLKEAILHIVNRNAMQYEEMITFLSDNQLSLLKAIAHEGCVASPQSGSFIRQYELSSASSIKTALTSLLEKDIVHRQSDGYIVYDHFLELWLKRMW